jgi:outer membrane protein assembly factor BamB
MSVRRTLLSLSITLALAESNAACSDDAQGSRHWLFPAEVPPAPADTWPQYRLDANHQGLSPSGTGLLADLALFWQSGPHGIGTYSASKSSPAVDIDRVYVGVDDGQLLALDRRNGTVAWRFQSRRYQVERETTDSAHLGIHGSPAVDERNAYIGDYSGWLYAIDKLTGALVWEIQLGGSIGASPVLLGEFLFIAVEYPVPDGKVFVIRAQTGEVVWASASLGAHPHSSVSVDAASGLLFVGANNGVLFCFDYVRGRQQWSYPTGGAIKSTAAVVGDTVYFTSWDGKLYGILSATGEKRLELAATAASMSSPAVHEALVFFGSDDGVLRAVNHRDGSLAWAFPTLGPIVSSPTVIQDSALLAIGSRDRHLYLVDLATGGLRQAIELSNPITSVPVAVGDAVFVNDDAGTVYALRSVSAASR